MTKLYLYARFERFWHWTQAGLIIWLMITGFEIHGEYELLGFGRAVQIHTLLAWTLMGLWVFAIFWHLTTGAFRHYLPSNPLPQCAKSLAEVARYYALGTFLGEKHPFRKSVEAKHNPLQRMAYLLFFATLVAPVIWVSGLAYLFYPEWQGQGPGWLSLGTVAIVHTAAAFGMLIFFIAHVYMATMGKTVFSLIKGIITGYEEVEH